MGEKNVPTILPALCLQNIGRVGWDKWSEERSQHDICVAQDDVRKKLNSALGRSGFAVAWKQ